MILSRVLGRSGRRGIGCGFLQRLVDLDVALQYVCYELGQVDSLVLGLAGKVFPHASLNRSGQKDLRLRRDVVKSANTLAEVDLCWHLVIFDGSIIHKLSS